MASLARRRQILLFLVAIILPCSVLVALGVRMIGQERELSEKRLADEQRRAISQIRQELLARLEQIKFQEVAALASQPGGVPRGEYQNPGVVLVAPVERGRVVLPWETDLGVRRARQQLEQPQFARTIEQGEREELVAKDLANATRLYQAAIEASRHPVQAAYARLLLARALHKFGQRREALIHLRRILAVPSQVTDEHGVAVSLYAAARLLGGGLSHAAVLERLRGQLQAQRWAPPAEAYMLRALVDTLVASAPDSAVRAAASDLKQIVSDRLRYVEQALAFQSDFPSLGLAPVVPTGSRNPDPKWIVYGQEAWLVSAAALPGGSSAVVVAVRAADVFGSLEDAGVLSSSLAGAAQLLPDAESQGEPLGPGLAGLRVRFSAAESGALANQWNLQRSFYLVTLLFVLSVTLLGAYLLWRDVRRDLRLAELRSQFVSGVSHELKTPLTAIRMFAETLSIGRSADPDQQQEYLDTIINESERLTRLLNNVLDFSKIEQGKKTYRFAPNSLADIVHASARAMQYPLEQQGFQLQLDVEDGMPPVRVDRDAIEQAILNLLTNAMKYSGEGRQIDLRLRKEDGRVLIEVSDHGVGIDPEQQARIFERFYRVPTPENQQVPGTGLGLTLVEHIAKAHGGRVAVKSAPTKGSTFTLDLPLEP